VSGPPLAALTISSIDAAIVVAYLVAVTLMGIWIGRDNKDVSDYLLGDRSLPWWAVLGSIVATETSTATFLSVPGIAFAKDGNFSFLQLAFGYVIGRILVSVWLLPLYFKGQLFTAYEVLHKRFGGLTQKTASLIFLVTRNLGDSLRLFLTAIVVKQVTGLSLTASIIVVGASTVAYTFVGGMKAVVWSDCLQFVIYVGGGIASLFLIIHMLPGGWTQFSEFAASQQKFRLLDYSLDPSKAYTIWAGVIGGAMLTMGTHGTDQMMVQRYLCIGSQKGASKALISSGFVVLAQFALFLMVGVALAAFYDFCGTASELKKNEEFITFIVNEMPPGMVGFTIAAVFSAAMSTLSSSLNSSAGAVVSDFLHNAGTPEHQIRMTRWMTLIFGILQIVLAIIFVSISLDRLIVDQVLAVAGFSSGILVGVFTLGVTTRGVGQISAMCGMVAGTAVLCYVKFFTTIAWPWYTLIGAVITIVCGLLVSLMLDKPRTDAHTEAT
jgi:solute:Na+ symporter, SSS family